MYYQAKLNLSVYQHTADGGRPKPGMSAFWKFLKEGLGGIKSQLCHCKLQAFSLPHLSLAQEYTGLHFTCYVTTK